MIENRELTMEDYLAMLRRRLKIILIPALLAPLAGFLISYAFPPKYTSQALIIVEGQQVPDTLVQSVVTQDLGVRFATLWTEVRSPNVLRTTLQGIGITKSEEQDKLISDISNSSLYNYSQQADVTSSSVGLSSKTKTKSQPVPGFYLNCTDSNAQRVQQICTALVSSVLTQNSKSRAGIAQGTTEFLSRQLDDAKRALDAQDAKLADFKKHFMGQLPGDADNNVRILMSMNSQLDASTQTLNRAQQDKSYTESMLAQQLAAWKSSQSSTNPQTLEQQLSTLQSQLLQLQARYTADHPDVIKTKADIAEVQKKLDQLNKAAAGATDTNDKANLAEPPEIRQLRLQIHQYDGVIQQSTADQKRLQSQIQLYQSRAAMSPGIEEQYKLVTRDYDNAQNVYQDLLKKKSSSELATSMEDQQQGERMRLAIPANTPDSPSFPNRPLFAGAGLGAGLALGLFLAIVLEFGDKSIRTEKDAAAAMDLPLLVSVPWLGDEEEPANGGGERRHFWSRYGSKPKDHEKVEV